MSHYELLHIDTPMKLLQDSYFMGSGSGAVAFVYLKPKLNISSPPSNIKNSLDKYLDDRLLWLWDSDPSIFAEKRDIYAQALDQLSLINCCFKRGDKVHWIQRRL